MEHLISLRGSHLRREELGIWLDDNLTKDSYMWDIYPVGATLYFKYEADLVAFRLRWGV